MECPEFLSRVEVDIALVVTVQLHLGQINPENVKVVTGILHPLSRPMLICPYKPFASKHRATVAVCNLAAEGNI